MREIPVWEPLSEAALADQRATHDRKRAECPVARSPRGVTLFRHSDVVAAAANPGTFSSAVSAHRQIPNSLDPPEHTAFRAVIDPFFTPERMRALEPRLRVCSREIVEALPRRVILDAVTDFGYPFAVRAHAGWLGWHGVETELLAWMRENHAATRSTDRSRTGAAAVAFDEIALAQVRRRRAWGGDAPQDPTTELLYVRVNGQQLSDPDIVSILRNWTAADLGSIAAALGVVIHFLATHPEIQTMLRADAKALASAIDEMLRIDDPFLVNRRVVTAAINVAGFDLDPARASISIGRPPIAMKRCLAIPTRTGLTNTRRTILFTGPASMSVRGARWRRSNSSWPYGLCCSSRRTWTWRQMPHHNARRIRSAAGAGCRSCCIEATLRRKVAAHFLVEESNAHSNRTAAGSRLR
jgi:cytochrome P450